jgi:hypothetical protein
MEYEILLMCVTAAIKRFHEDFIPSAQGNTNAMAKGVKLK